MAEPPSSTLTPSDFPHTRWSVVLASREKSPQVSAAALETLCRAYWQPLYGYVRRCGHAPCDAQDITQEFFAQLLEHRWLDTVDRERGRLRTFLIVALKNFMAKEWRRARAQRRGGGAVHLQIDTALAESHLAAPSPGGETLEQAFDREWALTVFDRTLERLQAEFAASGRLQDFETLKGCLTAERGSIDYNLVATRLGASEGAARVSVHRLRKRFRELYRQEVAETLADGANLEDEMRLIAAALVRG